LAQYELLVSYLKIFLINASRIKVKKIASELGFDDEFYFSRFFKRNAAVSPQTYRETVGFSRGEA
jgi:transcriptional regulator GlxA family with amidase domain